MPFLTKWRSRVPFKLQICIFLLIRTLLFSVFNVSVCVCVCISTHVHVHRRGAYVRAGLCAQVYTWMRILRRFRSFFFWDRVSHWDLGLAKLLARKCQGSAGLHLPGAWITNVHHCVILFTWTLGIQLGSLTGYFHSQPPCFSFNLLALIRIPWIRQASIILHDSFPSALI